AAAGHLAEAIHGSRQNGGKAAEFIHQRFCQRLHVAVAEDAEQDQFEDLIIRYASAAALQEAGPQPAAMAVVVGLLARLAVASAFGHGPAAFLGKAYHRRRPANRHNRTRRPHMDGTSGAENTDGIRRRAACASPWATG